MAHYFLQTWISREERLRIGDNELWQCSGENVGCALRARKHAIGLVIVVKAFGDWVPVQLAFSLHRDVVDEAGGAGTMAELGGGGGLL